jgi:hypothetical protein
LKKFLKSLFWLWAESRPKTPLSLSSAQFGPVRRARALSLSLTGGSRLSGPSSSFGHRHRNPSFAPPPFPSKSGRSFPSPVKSKEGKQSPGSPLPFSPLESSAKSVWKFVESSSIRIDLFPSSREFPSPLPPPWAFAAASEPL